MTDENKKTKEELESEAIEAIEEKEATLNGDIKLSRTDRRAKVTRGEVIDIVQQVMDNINQISSYLMQDINTLYSKHVFQYQIQTGVIEDLLVEKGIVTQKELEEKYDEKIKALQEKAREIKEEMDGSERLATEQEDKDSTNKKVLEIINNNKKLDEQTKEAQEKIKSKK